MPKISECKCCLVFLNKCHKNYQVCMRNYLEFLASYDISSTVQDGSYKFPVFLPVEHKTYNRVGYKPPIPPPLKSIWRFFAKLVSPSYFMSRWFLECMYVHIFHPWWRHPFHAHDVHHIFSLCPHELTINYPMNKKCKQ